VARLARDPFVQAQGAIVAIVALAYIIPAVPRSWLAWYAHNWLGLPFMLLPPVACLVGADGAPPHERTSLYWLAGAFASWLGALIAYGLVPASGWSLGSDILIAVLYLGFYLGVLQAVERRPDLDQARMTSLLEQRLRSAGLAAFVAGWTVYYVVVQHTHEQSRAAFVLDSLTFVLLDLVLIARLLITIRTTDALRWRMAYAAFAVASAVLLVTDSLNVLVANRWLAWADGRPTDLIWALPGLWYVVAIRLGHVREIGSDADHVVHDVEGGQPATSLGIYLLLGSLSFPIVHLALQAVAGERARVSSLADPALIVVVMSAALLASLAVAAYQLLERQRARMQQERRTLEAHLLQAQKMEAVGRLAGGIAHDFNNLLTVIAGNTDLARETIEEDDPARELLDHVDDAARRAAALTQQLLSFARRGMLKPAPVAVNAVVDGLHRILERVIPEHIALDVRCDPAAPTVLADAGQLEQVLLNLAINARDAMPDGGQLTITTGHALVDATTSFATTRLAPGHYARIAVRDTGVGIAPGALDHIFEPFFTTKEVGKGTGLGLATAYATVTQWGGGIDVATTAGRGSRFSVYLPATSAPVVTSAGTAADVPTRGHETVLVVEDEVDVRALVRRALEQRGYRVVEATSAPHAVELAGALDEPIHLLLTDVVMPELNGREVAERVRAVRPDTAVLFMSGYADDPGVHRGVLADRVHLIQKPFTPEALAARVRAELDARVSGAPPP